jgi:hypothetical protein
MIIFTPNTVIRSTDVNSNFSEVATIQAQVNPYKFSVYRTAAYATVANTWTKYPFNLEKYDTNNNFDITTNTYTVPITGYYFFTGRINMEQSGMGRGIISIWSSGSELLRGVDFSTTTGSQYLIPIVTGILYLTTGTSIELRYYDSVASTPATTDITTYFMGHLLSV